VRNIPVASKHPRLRSPEHVWFAAGAFFAFLSVAFGAFATHGLRARLSVDALTVFETGARYQMYHALALFAVAYAAQRWGGGMSSLAGGLFVAGIVLFSGSLYGLAISGTRTLGLITPLGGLAFLAGWAVLAVVAIRG
jgi:uncharacterized membrane protein YgdD (TMEM256/DUF423 family)